MLKMVCVKQRESFLIIIIKDNNITLCNHVGRFHDPRICQLYYVHPSEQSKNIHLISHAYKLTFGNMGGFILPTLLT